MTQSNKVQRYEMQWSSETHQLAERAANAGGFSSIKDLLTRLVHENAPQILKDYAEIRLTNEQFDAFIESCEKPKPASPQILAAAKALDEEGFDLNVTSRPVRSSEQSQARSKAV